MEVPFLKQNFDEKQIPILNCFLLSRLCLFQELLESSGFPALIFVVSLLSSLKQPSYSLAARNNKKREEKDLSRA